MEKNSKILKWYVIQSPIVPILENKDFIILLKYLWKTKSK